MTMNDGDIRQALLTATLSLTSVAPSGGEVDEFMAVSNPHEETDPTTSKPVLVADFHCQTVSFAVPVSLLETLRTESLTGRVGQFLNITGRDVNGRNRTYSFKITQDTILRLAQNIYVVLSLVHGEEFVKAHALDWTEWMQ